MAQLTSDIVWLVEQTVTLPDGSTQRVLVPQVYVRVQPGDIDGSGALLRDRTIIKGAGPGDLINSGTIAGRSMVSISADNVNNLGGRISGGNVALDARADINVIWRIGRCARFAGAHRRHHQRPHDHQPHVQGTNGASPSSTALLGFYVTNPGGSLIASAGRTSTSSRQKW